MHIYIVRHGLCRHNMPDSTGVVDDPLYKELAKADGAILVPQGILQAELTGYRLRNVSFDAVYASPTSRTIMTAEGIIKHQKKPLEIHLWRDLLECGMLPCPSPSSEIILSVFKNLIWDHTPPADEPETDESMWQRALRVNKFLREKYKGEENILLVSHGAFMGHYLVKALLEIPESLRSKYILCAENACITKMHIRPDGVTVLNALDETGHLGDAVSREPFDDD